METVFDFLSVAIFVATVGVFFQFNRKVEQNITPYIFVAIGCAFGNYFGNKNFDEVGYLVLGVSAFYLFFYIIRKEGVPDSHD